MDYRRIRSTRLAAATTLAVAFAAVGEAQALETGCRPAQYVRDQLHLERQFTLVSGERAFALGPKNIFTSNERGSLGYQVEVGAGPDSGALCVRAKYTDVQANDNADFARPEWANFGETSEFERWLTVHEALDQEKILFKARSVVRVDSQSEVLGSYILISTGNRPAGVKTEAVRNVGSVNIVDGAGKTTQALNLANVERNQPNYAAFAKRGRP